MGEGNKRLPSETVHQNVCYHHLSRHLICPHRHTHSLSIGNAITNFETGFHGLRFICKKKLPNNQGKHLFFISDFLGSATLKELSPTFIVTDSMVFQGKALISLCYWVGFKEFLVCVYVYGYVSVCVSVCACCGMPLIRHINARGSLQGLPPKPLSCGQIKLSRGKCEASG